MCAYVRVCVCVWEGGGREGRAREFVRAGEYVRVSVCAETKKNLN